MTEFVGVLTVFKFTVQASTSHLKTLALSATFGHLARFISKFIVGSGLGLMYSRGVRKEEDLIVAIALFDFLNESRALNRVP